MSKQKNGTARIIVMILMAAVVIAAAAIGYMAMHQEKASKEADAVIEEMKVIIPGLGADVEESSGNGKDPLSVMIINDTSIVGALQIPSIDLLSPVAAKGTSKAGFATANAGSPLKGNFRLDGSRQDVYSKLTKVKPGDKVIFTDADGARYIYSVVTQFHLKKWDKADYDLMLTYKVDDDTRFVVGCSLK